MSQGRVRALLAAVVAIAAVLGITIPGGGDDGTTTSTARSAPAATEQTSTSVAQTDSTDDSSSTAGPAADSSDDSSPTTGPSPSSEEGGAIAFVLARRDAGEASPYSQDGGTFENREGILPSQSFGYYREYTVETPGSPDRGARRLVIGADGDTWYTNDHYSSFTRIDPDAYR